METLFTNARFPQRPIFLLPSLVWKLSWCCFFHSSFFFFFVFFLPRRNLHGQRFLADIYKFVADVAAFSTKTTTHKIPKKKEKRRRRKKKEKWNQKSKKQKKQKEREKGWNIGCIDWIMKLRETGQDNVKGRRRKRTHAPKLNEENLCDTAAFANWSELFPEQIFPYFYCCCCCDFPICYLVFAFLALIIAYKEANITTDDRKDLSAFSCVLICYSICLLEITTYFPLSLFFSFYPTFSLILSTFSGFLSLLQSLVSRQLSNNQWRKSLFCILRPSFLCYPLLSFCYPCPEGFVHQLFSDN